jgi:hypothetical protein
MCTDIIKILKFVLIVLKENDKEAFKAPGVYDVYRQFFRVVTQARGVLDGRLKWKIEDINSDTSFGSAEKKWLYFNNQYVRKFEEEKHKLLVMFHTFETEYANAKNEDVFRNNFLSKSLNGRIDEYSRVAHIDENFQLIVYHVNFVTNAKMVKALRHFDELFKVVKFDLSTEKMREKFIEKTKLQIEKIYRMLDGYEKIMAEYYTINDLFLKNEQNR